MPLVKVTAELVTKLALSPMQTGPQLDEIVSLQMCRHLGSIKRSPNHQIQPKGEPVKVQGQIPSPIRQTWVEQGGSKFPVPHVSMPIIEKTAVAAEHYSSSFPTHRALEIEAKQRTKIARGGGQYKSFRLPLSTSDTRRVVWFAELREKKEIKRAPASWLRGILKHVTHVGKKSSLGYGMVGNWIVEPTDIEAHWFNDGVLMRTLPASLVSNEVLGKRRSFGAVAAPYWQADIFCECYTPV